MKKYNKITKKGSFGLDLALIVVVLFGFIILTFVASNFFGDIKGGTEQTFEGYNASSDLMDMGTNLINGFDYLFMFCFFMLWIFLLVSVFFIDSHPVFIGLGIFVLLIILFISVLFGDVFTQITTNTIFSDEAETFTLISFFMENIVLLILGMGATVLVALYAKLRLSG